MKTNKFILYTIFAAFLVSCDGQLDIDPRQREDASITLSTEKGISDVLSGAYSILANGDAYGGRIQVSADLLAQTGVTSTTNFRWRGTFATFRQMYTKTMLVDNGQVQSIWQRSYEIINATNVVMENIDKVQDPDRAKVMVAEAKFLQGLVYFDLVRLFAKPYDAAVTANSQLGVVIRPKAIYNFDSDLSAERSSVDEVYKLIINSLNQAYTDLPADNGFFANKYAAKALLARVYLQQQNYPAALSAAQDVIANSGAKLSATYKDAFNHDVNQIEDIFAIQITKQTGDNQLVNHYGSEDVGGRGGDVEIRTTYLNKFTDLNDERRNFNYINPDNGRRLSSKFTNEFGDVPMIRLAELILIRAEANFRLGSSIGATPLVDINSLRTRAKAANFTSITLAQILNERVLELAMEGFAIHDVKRTKGNIGGTYNWDSNLLVFPIPLRETDNNKKITQNPGY
ncbi:RagB/SusD family nutrient uptake outer membrane protein [Flavobacterium nackdongense]|uniref:RagB/SusD family nutrient uptake outer membrane protein n=1 Tax=Flavobacterium nackdongense TaxID=2547394 RepID=A0A4P6Y5W0_9FLAO|nr:RagB/SusD family nutrient uptake outer membrane protein [Flavobacterium nackdongense]QBN17581.1 RagB/SusD family nutrient uptake outer membrane protein [Flavobacterium nackdongense]